MAYPTISAPYGLKPVNLMGGRVYAGSTRMFPILSGYGTSLFNGDVVQIGSTTSTQIGTLIASSFSYNDSSVVNGTIGVFVGCEYSSTGGPIYGKNRYQYWQASTAAPDAVGYVVDDPFAYFRTAVVSGGAVNGTTIQYVNQAYTGSNAYYIPGAGSTSTGDSTAAVAISASATSTSLINPLTTTAPFRIVQVVPDTAVTVLQSATSSSTTITLSAANTAILPGMAVNGPGITNGSNTYVTTVNGTTVTINKAVSSAQSTATTFTFTGYPEVIVGWNPSYHSYFNTTGV
jgi:flagellar capping protein FliD